MNKNWRNGPTIIEFWPPDIDYVLAIDENGTPDLRFLRKCIKNNITPERNHIQFTVSGACFSRDSYADFKYKIDEIKQYYWQPDGTANYKGERKKVCLHYSEIHNKEHPFNIPNYDEFLNKLHQAIAGADCEIFSCSMNKYEHLIEYGESAWHPYYLSMGFILERYCHLLNQNEYKGIIIIESRQEKNDKRLLKHLINILENGHYPNPATHFRNIMGIYFNPKWRLSDNSQSTYSILEYVDYIGRIIHDHVYYDSKDINLKFRMIESKLYNPRGKYDGWGLKLYPNRKKMKTASAMPGG